MRVNQVLWGGTMRRILFALLLVTVISVLEAQYRDKNDTSIIARKSELVLISDRFTNLEGPTVSPEGILYFVDLIFSRIDPMGAAKIMSYNPGDGNIVLMWSPSGRTVGMEFDARGLLICAEFADGGGRRITERNVQTGEARFLALGYDGKPFNGLNDLTIDVQGRIYFTDYGYATGAETFHHGYNGLYRIDTDGVVTRIVMNAGKPNGIVISPDQKTLYITTKYDIWSRGGVLAYDLSASGELEFRSVFVDYGADVVGDGMTVDVRGNLYVGIFKGLNGPGVAVYSPQGKELAFIRTPTRVQNVAFGRGDKNKLLYIVGGSSMYKIELEVQGYHLPLLSP